MINVTSTASEGKSDCWKLGSENLGEKIAKDTESPVEFLVKGF